MSAQPTFLIQLNPKVNITAARQLPNKFDDSLTQLSSLSRKLDNIIRPNVSR